VLWQVEVALVSSKPTPQACREAGTTEQTYYGFNVRLRYAVFFDIAEVRDKLEPWRQDYNQAATQRHKATIRLRHSRTGGALRPGPHKNGPNKLAEGHSRSHSLPVSNTSCSKCRTSLR
jgi:hypothetical protein